MRPRTAFSLITTRAPIFFARSQSAALLMLASGAIVVTLVPFRLRIVSMVIACSHRVASPPVSSRRRKHGTRAPRRGILTYHIGTKQSAGILRSPPACCSPRRAQRAFLKFGFNLSRAELSNRPLETNGDFPKHPHVDEAVPGWVRIDHGECSCFGRQ